MYVEKIAAYSKKQLIEELEKQLEKVKKEKIPIDMEKFYSDIEQRIGHHDFANMVGDDLFLVNVKLNDLIEESGGNLIN